MVAFPGNLKIAPVRFQNRFLSAIAEGTFKILIVKDGADHRVYALDGDRFELATSYLDDDATMVSFDSIVLLVNNATAQNGVGEFGVLTR